MSGKRGSKPRLLFFFAFTLLILICSAPSAEDKRNDLPDAYYSGIFDVKVDFKDIVKLHNSVGPYSISYKVCRNMVMRVAIGINISNSEVIGQTFNLADGSSKNNLCFELFNGDLSGELESDGSFSGISFFARPRSSNKSYRTKLTGSISEGSKFNFVAGFPLGSRLGQSVKVTKGVISSVIGDNDPTRFQFDAAVSGGNSGGPIVRPDGVVVGVTVSGMVGDVQNINFGIKVQSLTRFLDHFAIPFSSHTVFDEKNIDLALHLTANTIHIGCFGDPTDDASSFDEYQ